MPGNELRGNGRNQQKRANQKVAALAGAVAGRIATETGQMPQQPQLPTPGVPGADGLPPPPPGFAGVARPDLLLPELPQTGAGALPASGVPAPQVMPGPSPSTPAPASPPLPYKDGGVVRPEPPTLRARYGSRRELEAEMLPGVRPIGNILTAPRIFDMMEQFLLAQREGRELPRFATGGVIAPRSLPDAEPELDLGALADMAGLDEEEQALWDGSGSDEPAPEMFEDWLVDVAPESEYALERDLADLYDGRPELASGLWGLVKAICKQDDSSLSPGLVRMVKTQGKGYSSDTGPKPDTNPDIPPAPSEAY